MNILVKIWTKCFGSTEEIMNRIFLKNWELAKVLSATFGLGMAIVKWMSCVHPHTVVRVQLQASACSCIMCLFHSWGSQDSLSPFQGHPGWRCRNLACLFVFSAPFAREYFATMNLRDFQALRKMLFDHWTNSSWLLWIKNCYSAEIKPKQHSGSKVFCLKGT